MTPATSAVPAAIAARFGRGAAAEVLAVGVLGEAEDERVQHDDVGHREEGDEATADLPADGRAALRDLEEAFEEAGVRRGGRSGGRSVAGATVSGVVSGVASGMARTLAGARYGCMTWVRGAAACPVGWARDDRRNRTPSTSRRWERRRRSSRSSCAPARSSRPASRLWVVALVVTLVVPALHTGDRSWWPWTCVIGIALGAIAWWYVGRGHDNAAA